MKQSEWSDKQLENLLKQMPHFKDHRDPQEIYQNISLKHEKKRKKNTILPGSLAAAVLFIMFLMIPNVLKDDASMLSSDKNKLDRLETATPASEDGKGQTEIENKATAIVKNEPFSEEGSAIAPAKEQAEASHTHDQNVEFKTSEAPLTEKEDREISILNEKKINSSQTDRGAPISEKDQTSFAIANNNERKTDGAIEKPERLKEPGGQSTMLTVPESAASDGKSLKDRQEESNGEKTLMITSKRAYFVHYGVNNQSPILIPSKVPFENIEKALEAMKNDVEGTEIKSSIPSHVKMMIREDGQQLFLTFEHSSDLNNEEATLMVVKAILLTAREFDYTKVSFENFPFTHLGDYDFSQAIDVHLAVSEKSQP